MKLKRIRQELTINVAPERMWELLSQYGYVARFHAGMLESHSIASSKDQDGPGCDRLGHIYEKYEWKNFPIHKIAGLQTLCRNR